MNSNDVFKIHGGEATLAAQEWGIKEGLRLFGYIWRYTVSKAGTEDTPLVKGYFVDTSYKNVVLAYFVVKENKGKVTLARANSMQIQHVKGNATGFKWPIKITRTKEFITKDITPIYPLYQVLVDRKIILPFQSQMKNKEWAALPFEDKGDMKSTEI